MKALEKPAANPGVVSRQLLDGEAVLVNLDTAASLALMNPMALLIWQLVDGQRTAQDIIAAIRRECPDAPPSADDDIIEMLDLLEAREFIRVE